MTDRELQKTRIIELLRKLSFIMHGRKPFNYERQKVGARELRIFGFRSSLEMTNEDLSNFEIFLKARVKAAHNHKALPGPFKI